MNLEKIARMLGIGFFAGYGLLIAMGCTGPSSTADDDNGNTYEWVIPLLDEEARELAEKYASITYEPSMNNNNTNLERMTSVLMLNGKEMHVYHPLEGNPNPWNKMLPANFDDFAGKDPEDNNIYFTLQQLRKIAEHATTRTDTNPENLDVTQGTISSAFIYEVQKGTVDYVLPTEAKVHMDFIDEENKLGSYVFPVSIEENSTDSNGLYVGAEAGTRLIEVDENGDPTNDALYTFPKNSKGNPAEANVYLQIGEIKEGMYVKVNDVSP